MAQELSRSLLIVRAISGAEEGSRKSSHGFAREMTLMEMLCWVMKARLTSRDEYEESMGRPREEGGLETSSSDGRMMRRGSEPSEGLWMYGTVFREDRRSM